MCVEPRLHFRIRRLGVRSELVHRERNHRQLHFLVALLEFRGDLAFRDGDPVGQRRLQLFHRDTAPDLVLELAFSNRRLLHREHLAVTVVADELAVLLECWDRDDPLGDFFVARGNVEAACFRNGGLLLHELLDDALVDAELLQQPLVHVGAVGGPILLHLPLIGASELVDRDVAAVYGGNRVVEPGPVDRAAAEKIWNVEQDERQDHQGKAPLEPIPVAAHPIEHRHGR